MQMQFVMHSEVKFVWVRIPRFRTWVRHWFLRRKISLAHTQRSTAIAQPNPYGVRQYLCGRVGEHQIACSDWLVCQTTSLCNNPSTCMARILARAFCAYVCSDVTRTAILNWGPFGRWTPGRIRLPAEPAFCAFGNTLCGRSHVDQHKTASPHVVNPLMKRVALIHLGRHYTFIVLVERQKDIITIQWRSVGNKKCAIAEQSP